MYREISLAEAVLKIETELFLDEIEEAKRAGRSTRAIRLKVCTALKQLFVEGFLAPIVMRVTDLEGRPQDIETIIPAKCCSKVEIDPDRLNRSVSIECAHVRFEGPIDIDTYELAHCNSRLKELLESKRDLPTPKTYPAKNKGQKAKPRKPKLQAIINEIAAYEASNLHTKNSYKEVSRHLKNFMEKDDAFELWRTEPYEPKTLDKYIKLVRSGHFKPNKI